MAANDSAKGIGRGRGWMKKKDDALLGSRQFSELSENSDGKSSGRVTWGQKTSSDSDSVSSKFPLTFDQALDKLYTKEKDELYSLFYDSDNEAEKIAHAERQRHYLRIPNGFLAPWKVDLSRLPFPISPGTTFICVTLSIYSPSEFYLSLPEIFPDVTNEFTHEITTKYSEIRKNRRLAMCLNDKRALLPGSYVVVRRKDEEAGVEWVRASIIKKLKIRRRQRRSREVPVERFAVRLVDFGDYIEVKISDILLMHENFAKEPRLAIRCRLALGNVNAHFHELGFKWHKKILQKFYGFLANKEISVRFIREVIDDDGESIWEVELLEFANNNVDTGGKTIHYLVMRTISHYAEEAKADEDADENVEAEGNAEADENSDADLSFDAGKIVDTDSDEDTDSTVDTDEYADA